MGVDSESEPAAEGLADEHDIFISYARVDRLEVLGIADDMERRQIKTWLDTRALQPGDEFASVIFSKIKAAKLFAVCIGATGLLTEWQVKEVSNAINLHKRIIPILLKDFPNQADQLELNLRDMVATDLRAGPHAVADLLTAIVKQIGAAETTGRRAAEPPRVSENEIEGLRARCSRATRTEIESSVGKKYIPALYVSRGPEIALHALFCRDAMLLASLQTLSIDVTRLLAEQAEQLADICLYLPGQIAFAAKTVASIQSAVDEQNEEIRSKLLPEEDYRVRAVKVKEQELRAAKNSEENLRQRLSSCEQSKALAERSSVEVKQLLLQIVESNSPNDAKHQPAFARLHHLISLSAKSENASAAFSQHVEFLQRHSGPITLIVERAGGGKTNLLCDLAIRHGESHPVIFMVGRHVMERSDSLFRELLVRLGWDGLRPEREVLAEIDGQLANSGELLFVFIDGINENRNLGKLNENLNLLLEQTQSSRIRFIISCRDIYWSFFEGAHWTAFAGWRLRGDLYQFSSDERDRALALYVRHYNIEVQLGDDARKRLRHPLMLRFFCEVHSNARLGLVSDIRIKSLFDDYWTLKVAGIGGTATPTMGGDAVVSRLAMHMLRTTFSAVPYSELPEVTKLDDLESRDSSYVKLLDEDIILDEQPEEPEAVGEDSAPRRVVFVYEEFMEYAIARALLDGLSDPTLLAIKQAFLDLKTKRERFVNVVAITEYLAAHLFDRGFHEAGIHLLVCAAESGAPWTSVIGNTVTKYDGSLAALTYLHRIPELLVPRTIHLLLESIRQTGTQRSALVDCCAVMAIRLLCPEQVSFAQVCHASAVSNVPLPVFTIEADDPYVGSRATRELLRAITSQLKLANILPFRGPTWVTWASEQPLHDPYGDERAHLLQALLDSLKNLSPRREQIATYFCNGLFHAKKPIRSAALVYARELSNPLAKQLVAASKSLVA